LVTNFHYDGQGPAGYWWASSGRHQNKNGDRLEDENGSRAPLRAYAGETVVISLPQGKTIYDYDWFGVWCEDYFVDFGSTRLPHSVQVPPSPRMLGLKPEVSPFVPLITSRPQSAPRPQRKRIGITSRPSRQG
jgi:hypothetical protein